MKKNHPFNSRSLDAATASSVPNTTPGNTPTTLNHSEPSTTEERRFGADTLTAFDSESDGIYIEKLSKSYGDELILNGLSLTLAPGRIYCLMAPSGAGKTTLFRILMGLEQADSGSIHGLSERRIAAVFQENRLLEGYTALENLRFVTGRQYSNEELTSALLQLLSAEALNKPVCEFSGGMKRRTAILRAILAPSDFIIMDEPFTGLDAETKKRAIDLILKYTAGKLLLLSTHNEEDVQLLSAEVIHLDRPVM